MYLPKRKNSAKLIGTILGFLIGGTFFSSLIGFLIGYLVDKQEERHSAWTDVWNKYGSTVAVSDQGVFTLGVIVLSAKMAKVDGRVNREEIDAFKRVFGVSPNREAEIGEIFDKARLSSEGFEPYAFQLAKSFQKAPEILEEILTGLFVIATADNYQLSQAEIGFLEKVAFIFGFDHEDFIRIAARAGIVLQYKEANHQRDHRGSGSSAASDPPSTLNDYTVLGVKQTATNDEIKSVYRSLIRKHHPDALMAQGLPPEFVATATEKMKRINVAYGNICKERGIK